MSQGEYFKIVYCKDLGDVEPVPSRWEENGILWWPNRLKDVRMFQRDISSTPDKKKWKRYENCKVKVQGFVDFNFASSAADGICEDEDSTSQESEEEQVNNKRVIKPPMWKYKDHMLNSVAYALQDKSNCTQDEVETSEATNSRENSENLDQTLRAAELCDDTDVCPVILSTQSDIKDILDAIEVFKLEVTNKLSGLQLQIERVENIMQDKLSDFQTQIVQPEDKLATNLFPFSTVESVNAFEDKLKCGEFRKKIILHLRRVIGSGYPWRPACYKLCSVLFTKKLLTFYSWTGVSRTQSNKVSFSKLVNILDVFYAVIVYADNNFSHSQKEQFFRDGVLKHSQTRLNPKRKSEKLNKNEGETKKEENLEIISDLSSEEPVADLDHVDDDLEK